jgi:hypothetical protein
MENFLLLQEAIEAVENVNNDIDRVEGTDTVYLLELRFDGFYISIFFLNNLIFDSCVEFLDEKETLENYLRKECRKIMYNLRLVHEQNLV